MITRSAFLNALALSSCEQAIRQARDVDSELKRGRTRGPSQGILTAQGPVVGQGPPHYMGSQTLRGPSVDQDAYVVEKLKGLAAILRGKLATVEPATAADIAAIPPRRSPAPASTLGPGPGGAAGFLQRRPRGGSGGGVGHVWPWSGDVRIDHYAQRVLRCFTGLW